MDTLLDRVAENSRTQVKKLRWMLGLHGLASIVFGVIVLEGSVLEHRDLIITVVIVTVGLSVYAHGVTAVPLAGAYARWYAGHREPPRMESAAVHEHRVRRADLGAPARARPGP